MTVAGLYTIAELRDLIAAKDSDILAINSIWQGFDAQWQTQDPATEAAWVSDWHALTAKYDAARALAETEIAVSDIQPIPDDVNPEGDIPYKAIIAAIQPVPMTRSPGDLEDLYSRLGDAMGAPVILPPTPQPTPGTDVDLNVYNQAGQAQQALNGLGQKFKNGLPGEWEVVAIGVGAAVAGLAVLKVLL